VLRWITAALLLGGGGLYLLREDVREGLGKEGAEVRREPARRQARSPGRPSRHAALTPRGARPIGGQVTSRTIQDKKVQVAAELVAKEVALELLRSQARPSSAPAARGGSRQSQHQARRGAAACARGLIPPTAASAPSY